jgi:hypothetical protein
MLHVRDLDGQLRTFLETNVPNTIYFDDELGPLMEAAGIPNDGYGLSPPQASVATSFLSSVLES